MTTANNAIETWYAGCKFRSRLEARWAVFFDTLGVKWEYEPQGYEVPYWNRDDPRRRYLPDFWLPNDQMWTEVKGQDRPEDFPLLVGATWDRDGLPVDPYGTATTDDNRNGPRLLILGPIPDLRCGSPLHRVLHHHKGDISWGYAKWLPDRLDVCTPRGFTDWVASDSGRIVHPLPPLAAQPMIVTVLAKIAPPTVATAYIAARSARFEHGQSGAS